MKRGLLQHDPSEGFYHTEHEKEKGEMNGEKQNEKGPYTIADRYDGV